MTITGQVVDTLDGSPIPSASVTIMGTSSGTAADANGNFELTDDSLNDPDSVVVFTDVDYNDYATSLQNASGLIYMAKKDSTLASVVVVAKRAVKKKGSIAAIVIAIAFILLIVNYKKILKWSTGIFILFACSCSSVKKVNQDTKKQLQVIDNFQSTHPLKNDTTFITLPSDTVIQSYYTTDTVQLPGIGQTQFKDRIITKTLTVTKTITDTVIQKVTDRKMEYALQAIIVDRNTTISNQKLQIEQYKHRSERWFWFFVGLLAVDTLYLLIRLKVI
jgi:hypothetical protein